MVDFLAPESLDEALRIRHEQPVIPFAGGTDLMVRQRSWAGTLPAFDRTVLYLGEIAELKLIRQSGGLLEIGAAATLTDLLVHPAVPDILKQAIAQMASPAIRNRGTLGGNLCNASPAADTAPPLYAAGAAVQLKNAAGSRILPLEAFILGPGRTALAGDELLTSIHLPLQQFNLARYRKVGTRKANALAKLSFAGLAQIDSQIIADVRFAFGAVAPTVVRSKEIEASLRGRLVGEIPYLADEISNQFARLILPIDDQRSSSRYRKTVALRLLADFLGQLADSARDVT